MHKHVRIVLPVFVVLLAAVIMLAAMPAQAAAPEQPSAAEPQATPVSLFPSPNERIGLGLVGSIADITAYDVTQLEAGWYGDWSVRLSPPHPNGMDFLPLITTHPLYYPPNWDYLAEVIRRHPGSVWFVGNEQEAAFQENQTPAQYVQKYREIATFVKGIDATALMAIGGVILPSPLRLQWIDMVLQEYQTLYGTAMPVDVWNTHMQMVNEVSCTYDPGNCWGAEIPAGITADYGITMTLSDNVSYDLFVRLIRDMRTWMNARGFRNKPLVVSEYGVLMPSSYLCDACGENPALGDALVASFMTRTFEFMLTTTDLAIGYPADGNRLVQRWMWYTLNDKPYDFETGEGFNGGLFDYRNTVYPGTLTYFGQVFKDFVAPLKVPYRDLTPSGLRATRGGGMYVLTANVANLGNSGVSDVKVRLYAGDPAAGGMAVGSDVTIPLLGIRHTPPVEAAFTFAPPDGVDARTYYVVVDPDNLITESLKSNNTASLRVRFTDYAFRIMLPVIGRNYQFGAK